MLTLTVNEWTRIRKQLREEYAWKPSVLMIRDVMRRELGMTIRYHRTYTEQRGSEEIIYVDFFNESAESHFRLKYL